MGFSQKSHGKRSDKETQSPMLKIFKDMMHKEKHDPEKTNLLKDKHAERKRKHYSGSRSKSGHKTIDSSSSDRQKHAQPYKTEQQEIMRNAEYETHRTQSIPFQGEKRDSWWFWGEKNREPAPKSKGDDTCSCVSCALKKIISTEYACIACLTILFALSVVIAIWLVYRSVPCIPGHHPLKEQNKNKLLPRFEDRLKRKTDGGSWNFGAKKPWMNPFSRSQNPSFGSFKFQDLSLDESENDLSKILDADKMSEIQNSDQLRDFYKKLIQTDAAIRNLRKSFNENSYVSANRYDVNNNNDFNSQVDFNNEMDVNNQIDFSNNIDINTNQDRTKRSLKLFHRPKLFYFKRRDRATKPIIDNGKVVTKTTVTMTTNKKTTKARNKRFDGFNGTEGFVIEKNQVVIQYKPIPNRIVAKCSHTPKDSNSHEAQLKHPFYKNTQRLDELLDQIMDKKLPDLMSDSFDMTMMNDQKIKCKHPQTEEPVTVKNDDRIPATGKDVLIKVPPDKNVVKEETKIESTENAENAKTDTDTIENDFFDDSDGVDKKKERSSSSAYDILLSISTIINPVIKRTTSFPSDVLVDRVPNLRKLMQVDMKEDEGVGYEDLKEVLADDKEGHDDNDKESDRKKRNDASHASTFEPEMKHFPNSVHNPNWKGPMPLYPEELHQIVKERPYAENKVEIPVHNADSASETDELEIGLTDVQYVEDYLDNGYEKLVKLAQAYSDYGVFNEKKDADTEKKVEEKAEHKLDERKVGTSMDRFKHGFKHGFHKNFERLKKGTNIAEGIRIEIHPTTSARDDDTSDLYKLLQKHVKITNIPHGGKANRFSSFIPTAPTVPLTEFHQTASKGNEDNKAKLEKGIQQMDTEGVVFTVHKKRTLKSIDYRNNYKSFNDDTTVMTDVYDMAEIAMNKFKRDTLNTLSKVKQANETKLPNRVNVDDIALKTKFSNISKENEVKQRLLKKGNMTISDFFMLLSDWFSAMDAAQEKKTTAPYGIIPKGQHAILEKRNNINNLTTTISLPEYDSDMIENIGHRSRVLLSIEENNNVTEEDTNSKDDDDQNVELSSSTEPMNTNTTISMHETTETIANEITNENSTKNRIVKRQATDDSNLIFWNDLYDDEYGVKLDPFETNIRDKHSVNKNDFIKRSNTWIQDKVKTFTNKLNFRNARRISRQDKREGTESVKRSPRSIEDEEESGKSDRVDFVALTAKMKDVCKKTAKIVQQTKNIQVREEKKEDHVASSLMQQLVRLMTDLVDFQVQERTCRKLPQDLQNFLEWLTSAKSDEETDSEPYSPDVKESQISDHFDKSTERDREQDLLQSNENSNSRTDCLGTLHAVQDLMLQYDHMSNEDKNTIPGVKTYLENQINFLQRQITSIDGRDSYNKDARFRRDVITEAGHKIATAIDATARTVENGYNHIKQIYHKCKDKMKHASKQAGKTTASVKEAASTVTKKIGQVIKPKCKQKVHKINDKCKESCKDCSEKRHHHHREKNIQVTHERDHAQNKDKVHLKDKDHLKDKMHHKHDKDKVHAKDKDKHTDDGEDKSDQQKSKSEDEQSNDRDERNIKDVYFKAVEEAKKISTVKSSHRRDSELFEEPIAAIG